MDASASTPHVLSLSLSRLWTTLHPLIPARRLVPSVAVSHQARSADDGSLGRWLKGNHSTFLFKGLIGDFEVSVFFCFSNFFSPRRTQTVRGVRRECVGGDGEEHGGEL